MTEHQRRRAVGPNHRSKVWPPPGWDLPPTADRFPPDPHRIGRRCSFDGDVDDEVGVIRFFVEDLLSFTSCKRIERRFLHQREQGVGAPTLLMTTRNRLEEIRRRHQRTPPSSSDVT